MSPTDVHKRLDRVYPPFYKIVLLLLLLLLIILAYVYSNLWDEAVTLFLLLIPVQVILYSMFIQIRQRIKSKLLNKKERYNELINLFLYGKTTRYRGRLETNSDIKQEMQINDLIDFVGPNGIDTHNSKSTELQIEEYMDTSKRDVKIVIIFFATIITSFMLLIFLEAFIKNVPVDWAHIIWILGGIGIPILISITSILKEQKTNLLQLTQYSKNVDVVISHYEMKIDQIYSKKLWTTKEKELNALPIEKIIEILRRYEKANSDKPSTKK